MSADLSECKKFLQTLQRKVKDYVDSYKRTESASTRVASLKDDAIKHLRNVWCLQPQKRRGFVQLKRTRAVSCFDYLYYVSVLDEREYFEFHAAFTDSELLFRDRYLVEAFASDLARLSLLHTFLEAKPLWSSSLFTLFQVFQFLLNFMPHKDPMEDVSPPFLFLRDFALLIGALMTRLAVRSESSSWNIPGQKKTGIFAALTFKSRSNAASGPHIAAASRSGTLSPTEDCSGSAEPTDTESDASNPDASWEDTRGDPRLDLECSSSIGGEESRFARLASLVSFAICRYNAMSWASSTIQYIPADRPPADPVPASASETSASYLAVTIDVTLDSAAESIIVAWGSPTGPAADTDAAMAVLLRQLAIPLGEPLPAPAPIDFTAVGVEMVSLGEGLGLMKALAAVCRYGLPNTALGIAVILSRFVIANPPFIMSLLGYFRAIPSFHQCFFGAEAYNSSAPVAWSAFVTVLLPYIDLSVLSSAEMVSLCEYVLDGGVDARHQHSSEGAQCTMLFWNSPAEGVPTVANFLSMALGIPISHASVTNIVLEALPSFLGAGGSSSPPKNSVPLQLALVPFLESVIVHLVNSECPGAPSNASPGRDAHALLRVIVVMTLLTASFTSVSLVTPPLADLVASDSSTSFLTLSELPLSLNRSCMRSLSCIVSKCESLIAPTLDILTSCIPLCNTMGITQQSFVHIYQILPLHRVPRPLRPGGALRVLQVLLECFSDRSSLAQVYRGCEFSPSSPPALGPGDPELFSSPVLSTTWLALYQVLSRVPLGVVAPKLFVSSPSLAPIADAEVSPFPSYIASGESSLISTGLSVLETAAELHLHLAGAVQEAMGRSGLLALILRYVMTNTALLPDASAPSSPMKDSGFSLPKNLTPVLAVFRPELCNNLAGNVENRLMNAMLPPVTLLVSLASFLLDKNVDRDSISPTEAITPASAASSRPNIDACLPCSLGPTSLFQSICAPLSPICVSGAAVLPTSLPPLRCHAGSCCGLSQRTPSQLAVRAALVVAATSPFVSSVEVEAGSGEDDEANVPIVNMAPPPSDLVFVRRLAVCCALARCGGAASMAVDAIAVALWNEGGLHAMAPLIVAIASAVAASIRRLLVPAIDMFGSQSVPSASASLTSMPATSATEWRNDELIKAIEGAAADTCIPPPGSFPHPSTIIRAPSPVPVTSGSPTSSPTRASRPTPPSAIPSISADSMKLAVIASGVISASFAPFCRGGHLWSAVAACHALRLLCKVNASLALDADAASDAEERLAFASLFRVDLLKLAGVNAPFASLCSPAFSSIIDCLLNPIPDPLNLTSPTKAVRQALYVAIISESLAACVETLRAIAKNSKAEQKAWCRWIETHPVPSKVTRILQGVANLLEDLSECPDSDSRFDMPGLGPDILVECAASAVQFATELVGHDGKNSPTNPFKNSPTNPFAAALQPTTLPPVSIYTPPAHGEPAKVSPHSLCCDLFEDAAFQLSNRLAKVVLSAALLQDLISHDGIIAVKPSVVSICVDLQDTVTEHVRFLVAQTNSLQQHYATPLIPARKFHISRTSGDIAFLQALDAIVPAPIQPHLDAGLRQAASLLHAATTPDEFTSSCAELSQSLRDIAERMSLLRSTETTLVEHVLEARSNIQKSTALCFPPFRRPGKSLSMLEQQVDAAGEHFHLSVQTPYCQYSDEELEAELDKILTTATSIRSEVVSTLSQLASCTTVLTLAVKQLRNTRPSEAADASKGNNILTDDAATSSGVCLRLVSAAAECVLVLLAVLADVPSAVLPPVILQHIADAVVILGRAVVVPARSADFCSRIANILFRLRHLPQSLFRATALPPPNPRVPITIPEASRAAASHLKRIPTNEVEISNVTLYPHSESKEAHEAFRQAYQFYRRSLSREMTVLQTTYHHAQVEASERRAELIASLAADAASCLDLLGLTDDDASNSASRKESRKFMRYLQLQRAHECEIKAEAEEAERQHNEREKAAVDSTSQSSAPAGSACEEVPSLPEASSVTSSFDDAAFLNDVKDAGGDLPNVSPDDDARTDSEAVAVTGAGEGVEALPAPDMSAVEAAAAAESESSSFASVANYESSPVRRPKLEDSPAALRSLYSKPHGLGAPTVLRASKPKRKAGKIHFSPDTVFVVSKASVSAPPQDLAHNDDMSTLWAVPSGSLQPSTAVKSLARSNATFVRSAMFELFCPDALLDYNAIGDYLTVLERFAELAASIRAETEADQTKRSGLSDDEIAVIVSSLNITRFFTVVRRDPIGPNDAADLDDSPQPLPRVSPAGVSAKSYLARALKVIPFLLRGGPSLSMVGAEIFKFYFYVQPDISLRFIMPHAISLGPSLESNIVMDVLHAVTMPHDNTSDFPPPPVITAVQYSNWILFALSLLHDSNVCVWGQAFSSIFMVARHIVEQRILVTFFTEQPDSDDCKKVISELINCIRVQAKDDRKVLPVLAIESVVDILSTLTFSVPVLRKQVFDGFVSVSVDYYTGDVTLPSFSSPLTSLFNSGARYLLRSVDWTGDASFYLNEGVMDSFVAAMMLGPEIALDLADVFFAIYRDHAAAWMTWVREVSSRHATFLRLVIAVLSVRPALALELDPPLVPRADAAVRHLMILQEPTLQNPRHRKTTDETFECEMSSEVVRGGESRADQDPSSAARAFWDDLPSNEFMHDVAAKLPGAGLATAGLADPDGVVAAHRLLAVLAVSGGRSLTPSCAHMVVWSALSLITKAFIGITTTPEAVPVRRRAGKNSTHTSPVRPKPTSVLDSESQAELDAAVAAAIAAGDSGDESDKFISRGRAMSFSGVSPDVLKGEDTGTNYTVLTSPSRDAGAATCADESSSTVASRIASIFRRDGSKPAVRARSNTSGGTPSTSGKAAQVTEDVAVWLLPFEHTEILLTHVILPLVAQFGKEFHPIVSDLCAVLPRLVSPQLATQDVTSSTSKWVAGRCVSCFLYDLPDHLRSAECIVGSSRCYYLCLSWLSLLPCKLPSVCSALIQSIVSTILGAIWAVNPDVCLDVLSVALRCSPEVRHNLAPPPDISKAYLTELAIERSANVVVAALVIDRLRQIQYNKCLIESEGTTTVSVIPTQLASKTVSRSPGESPASANLGSSSSSKASRLRSFFTRKPKNEPKNSSLPRAVSPSLLSGDPVDADDLTEREGLLGVANESTPSGDFGSHTDSPADDATNRRNELLNAFDCVTRCTVIVQQLPRGLCSPEEAEIIFGHRNFRSASARDATTVPVLGCSAHAPADILAPMIVAVSIVDSPAWNFSPSALEFSVRLERVIQVLQALQRAAPSSGSVLRSVKAVAQRRLQMSVVSGGEIAVEVAAAATLLRLYLLRLAHSATGNAAPSSTESFESARKDTLDWIKGYSEGEHSWGPAYAEQFFTLQVAGIESPLCSLMDLRRFIVKHLLPHATYVTHF